MSIKAVIIEDEPNSISTLKNLLLQLDKEVEVLAEAATVADGIRIINTHKPELVFMDIHLLDGTSFEIIDHTDYSEYEVIFITAYQQHAIKAFEIAAVHYLMKPVRLEQLTEAIERYSEHNNDVDFDQRMRILKSSLNNEQSKIILPLTDGLCIIRLEEVVRCESSNNYTTFFLRDKRQLVVSRPINFYENLLGDLHFARVHSKHLINLRYVERYIKGRGGQIILEGGFEVDVSTGKKHDFIEKLNTYARGY